MKKLISFMELCLGGVILSLYASSAFACSGALADSYYYEFKCTVKAVFDSEQKQSAVSFTGIELPEILKQVKNAIQIQGELETRKYETDSFFNYMDSILLYPMTVFVASKGKFPSNHVLDIQTVIVEHSATAGKEYLIHGTYDASLVGVYPKGAPLQVHLKF